MNPPLMDRRKSVMIRDIAVPVIAAAIVGIGSSFLATYIAINTVETKLQYIEKNLGSLETVSNKVNDNSMKIERLEAVSRINEYRIQKLEK